MSLLDAIDFSDIFGGATFAVAVTCYNRPKYLRRCLKSLKMMQGICEFPIIFFPDGGSESKLMENVLAIKAAGLKHVAIRSTDKNLGIEMNSIRTRLFAFDMLNIDFLLNLEEDFLPDISYLILLSNIWKYLTVEKGFDNIGAISAWNECRLSTSERIICRDVLKIGSGSHFWASLMPKATWDKIKPLVIHYKNSFCLQHVGVKETQLRFDSRDTNRVILDFLASRAKMVNVADSFINYQSPLKNPTVTQTKALLSARVGGTGLDALLELAFIECGLIRVRTKVNHGVYVGKNGAHAGPIHWQHDKKVHGSTILDIPSDNLLPEHLPKTFRII